MLLSCVDVHNTPPNAGPGAESLELREFMREEIRYVKAMPLVSPVSYPTRVAPLPEDRVKEEKDEEVMRENEQLARERRWIEVETSLIPKVEKESVPLPTLIKVEKNAQKVPFDLQEAIREVKMVRGATTLPHGTGKTVRVAVFAEGTTLRRPKL